MSCLLVRGGRSGILVRGYASSKGVDALHTLNQNEYLMNFFGIQIVEKVSSVVSKLTFVGGRRFSHAGKPAFLCRTV